MFGGSGVRLRSGFLDSKSEVALSSVREHGMTKGRRLPILVPIKGGLGNQLFQVCFAAHLSRLTERSVVIDGSWFQETHAHTTPRRKLIDPGDVGLKEIHLPRVIRALLRRYPWGFRFLFEQDSDFTFEKHQLERAFFIEGDFVAARFPLSNLEMSRQLVARSVSNTSKGRYVAVHSRLGDYFSSPANAAYFGVTDPLWLLEEGRSIAADLGVEEIRVFTDSPDVFVSQVGPSNLRSVNFDRSITAWGVLAGMRRAAGLVMSNSSLSWWGAFCATVLDERSIPVVMPYPWLARPSPADVELLVEGWQVRMRRLVPDP